MTYEEEQIKYAEEFKQVSQELKEFDELFKNPTIIDEKIKEFYRQLNPLEFKYQSTSTYEVQQKINHFRKQIEVVYRNKKARKSELERLLSQTPAERTKEHIKNNLGKSVDFIGSITPQHVSGRVYRIENGDGCGTFCLWFMIIDAIICFIIYLCTK